MRDAREENGMMDTSEALTILGLRRMPDSDDELRSAYLSAAARWHPDRAMSRGIDPSVASMRMSRVNVAHMTIRQAMRMRSKSRLGDRYSDPYDGSHFARDEFGYVGHSGVRDVVSDMLAGMRARLGRRGRKAAD